MPGYIGYTPQFNPISLQDYLAVPTMVMGEYAKAEDVYNETATKAEALKALLGERNADNEAGWRIIDNYERQLGDIANNIANGIQGPEAYRQARGASRYYRENILPLEAGIPAYQKELEKYNADPSMIGARPALENYIKNPLYRGYMLSGDKIYTDMVNQGKMVAADRSANDIKQSGITGYLNQIKSVGYSPEEQQEYYNLVNAAFTGDETATRILQSNAKYSQLYQGLVSYMMDHNFNDLDDNSRYSAFDRAVSGQLHGMTGTSTSTLVADKAWEHNSRMAAARASSGQAGQESSFPEAENHLIKPLARGANFGDKTVKRFNGNIYDVDSRGVIRLKSKDDFISAIGGVTRAGVTGKRTAAQIARMNNLINDIITDTGRLRTPEELLALINNRESKGVGEVSGHDLWTSDRVQYYRNMYNQLAAAGVDMNTSYAPITESGFGSRATSSVNFDKNAVFNNFYNTVSNIIGSTSPQSNTAYYNYRVPISNENITSIMAALPERFTVFTGLTMGDNGLTYTANGKAVKKDKIIEQAEESGATLEFSPIAGGYIIAINNNDEDKYFIPDESFDRTIHNYTDINWERYDQQLRSLKNEMDNNYMVWQMTQTPNAKQDYINACNAYYNLYNQYNAQLRELELGLLESDVFTSISSYNPNTATLRNQ